MLAQVGINDRMAQQMMSVSGNAAIAKASNCSDMPTAMRALYELSRLDPATIEQGIERGDIHPGMTSRAIAPVVGVSDRQAAYDRAAGVQDLHTSPEPSGQVGNDFPPEPEPSGPTFDPTPAWVPVSMSSTDRITGMDGKERPARRELESDLQIANDTPSAPASPTRR